MDRREIWQTEVNIMCLIGSLEHWANVMTFTLTDWNRDWQYYTATLVQALTVLHSHFGTGTDSITQPLWYRHWQYYTATLVQALTVLHSHIGTGTDSITQPLWYRHWQYYTATLVQALTVLHNSTVLWLAVIPLLPHYFEPILSKRLVIVFALPPDAHTWGYKLWQF
jgi:hypothetical protein